MLLFYGTRSTKIKEGKLKSSNVTCPHCQNPNTFNYAIYSRYAHFFWIPLFPFSKSKIVECSHCKKTYSSNDELPNNVRQALEKEQELNPVKRPIWQGCGCIIILFMFLPFLLGIPAYVIEKLSSDSDDTEIKSEDERVDKFDLDLEKMTNKLTPKDSIAYSLQNCINFSVEGINTEQIKYYTKINKNKLLVLLNVRDMKSIKRSSRKQVVRAVESCLDDILQEEYHYYIAVDGKWNLLMVQTPTESDLEGSFASNEPILSFYEDTPFGELKIKPLETKDSIAE